jgi:hypothetical protein
MASFRGGRQDDEVGPPAVGVAVTFTLSCSFSIENLRLNMQGGAYMI